MLRDGRRQRGLTQSASARLAGLSSSTWSWLEIGRDGRLTLATLSRAAVAVGSSINVYIRQSSAAAQPRDAVHLRTQELVIRAAISGGWSALPEEPIDREARTSRAADVLLCRGRPGEPTGYVLVEIWDWLADVGAAVRESSRRLDAAERYAIARMIGDDPLPIVGGIWVLRATRRNRQLVSDYSEFFRARFPGSGYAWLAALTDVSREMPAKPGLAWVTAAGDRLYPARIG